MAAVPDRPGDRYPCGACFHPVAPHGLAPLLLWTTGSNAAGALGTVATVGLVFLLILLAIVVAVVLTLLTRFFRRVCALEDLGVVESIRQGYGVARRHLKDVAIMWLIMAGVSIGVGVALFIVVILLLAVGVLLGGLPALLVGWLASSIFEGAIPWILAAAVGVPIFLLVLVVPLLFLSGLIEVFKSALARTRNGPSLDARMPMRGC